MATEAHIYSLNPLKIQSSLAEGILDAILFEETLIRLVRSGNLKHDTLGEVLRGVRDEILLSSGLRRRFTSEVRVAGISEGARSQAIVNFALNSYGLIEEITGTSIAVEVKQSKGDTLV